MTDAPQIVTNHLRYQTPLVSQRSAAGNPEDDRSDAVSDHFLHSESSFDRSYVTMFAMPEYSTPQLGSAANTLARDLTLVETLRVLEVARGLRQEREVAEVALARDEIRSLMRKRLMEAAVITGDKITEADVDAAIAQYFATQHIYQDPPMSFSVLLAHLWVRRFSFALVMGLMLFAWMIYSWLFHV